jgi:anthranilate phosphoribosyltransferase
VRTFEVTPEDAGLPRATPDALKGGGPEINAAALRAMLDGAHGAYRDIVILNAAAALVVAGKALDLKTGAALAADSIDSGKARRALDKMIAITTGRA